MTDGTTFVGLDVHKATIAIAVCRGTEPPESLGEIAHDPKLLLKRLRRIGPLATLAVCYEAGPCAFTPYRLLTAHGIACTVVAPSLIPVRPGRRIKTDSRDACQLARLLRSGDLTAVAVPTAEQEALRDLSRLRQSAVEDLHRKRQQLLKLLPRIDVAEPSGMRRWTKKYRAWLAGIRAALPAHQFVLTNMLQAIDDAQERLKTVTLALTTTAATSPFAPLVEALQQIYGVGEIVSIGLVAELGDLTRFDRAPRLMAYAGMVPSEYSSGGSTQRGAITKTGNAQVRRLIVEAAWHYARPIRAREPATTPIGQIADVARERLRRRYQRLVSSGKPAGVAVVAVARELLGFCWSIAHELATPSTPAPTTELAIAA